MKSRTSLQDLRRKIYIKAKSEPTRRFWGLYVHVCKPETLLAAYKMAKANQGACGLDGVTFASIENSGVDAFLAQIQDELANQTYRPARNRKVEIPKGNGKSRTLSIPTIRDRVVQGALRLILEPIFEADFHPHSYGYRPRKSAHDAIDRVAKAIAEGKTQVMDLDLRSFFDGVRHHLLLKKVAARVEDAKILGLLKLLLKAGGKVGIPQGGALSPLLSNIYLNEVDGMLDRAERFTQEGNWTYLAYARYADDLVVLLDPACSLSSLSSLMRCQPSQVKRERLRQDSPQLSTVLGRPTGVKGGSATVLGVPERSGELFSRSSAVPEAADFQGSAVAARQRRRSGGL